MGDPFISFTLVAYHFSVLILVSSSPYLSTTATSTVFCAPGSSSGAVDAPWTSSATSLWTLAWPPCGGVWPQLGVSGRYGYRQRRWSLWWLSAHGVRTPTAPPARRRRCYPLCRDQGGDGQDLSFAQDTLLSGKFVQHWALRIMAQKAAPQQGFPSKLLRSR